MENEMAIAETLEIAIKDVGNWSYYDNYQHGQYADENGLEYGPIKVFNATVEIDGKEAFGGDVSDRRFDLLKRLAKRFGVGVRVYFESCRDTKTLYWTISKTGVPRLVDSRCRFKRTKKRSSEEEKAMGGLSALFS